MRISVMIGSVDFKSSEKQDRTLNITYVGYSIKRRGVY